MAKVIQILRHANKRAIESIFGSGGRIGNLPASARPKAFWLSVIVCLLHCQTGAVSFAADVAEGTSFPPEQVEFFEKHVRPVLIARCFECHSSDARKVEASLLVESRTALLAGGDSGPAIIPGDPNQSLLIEAIRYEFVEMPPKQKLSDEEIAALVKWVEMGAPWPADGLKPAEVATEHEQELDWNALRESHWAFRPVLSPPPSVVVDHSWPRGDIDRFILSRLEQAELKPAPAASREVLIRRAYFDLIGLPPTPAEVDAFASDSSDDAFARLVDRLLESPHYGERWARHWLDVARYSDGLGGSSDGTVQPHSWRYRDWVIDALNRDLPFDQFVRLQIAGDLIDPENGVAATGFFALGPTYASDGGALKQWPMRCRKRSTIASTPFHAGFWDSPFRAPVVTIINSIRSRNWITIPWQECLIIPASRSAVWGPRRSSNNTNSRSNKSTSSSRAEMHASRS